MHAYEAELKEYIPYNEQEKQDIKVFLQYLIKFSDVYERKNIIGHITCSPWITNKEKTKVLMVYHNIYKSWGWSGGHCDGDKDLISVALREGLEETGLKKLKLVSDKILAIDVLPVPSHIKNKQFLSAHIHLNFTYLCSADEKEELHSKPDENSAVKWIPIEMIDEEVSEEAMKKVYHKLIEKSKLIN
ncbi:MAG: NUDIX hydrolase [Longicatena sp.]